jgi:hypothetical protein
MGALFGGIAGGIGGELFKPFGGTPGDGFTWGNFVATVKVGTVVGAALVGLSTAINPKSNFLQNVAFGALGGAMGSAVGFAAANSIDHFIDDPTVEIGSRSADSGTGGEYPAGEHKFIRFPGKGPYGGRIVEMAPDENRNIAIYDTDGPNDPANGRIRDATAGTKWRLIERPDSIKWAQTDISQSKFDAALQTYIANHATQPYGVFRQNSNYFVDYVISNAGGNSKVPGAWNPQCVPWCR